MNLVREHIKFERNIDPKKSMKIGVGSITDLRNGHILETKNIIKIDNRSHKLTQLTIDHIYARNYLYRQYQSNIRTNSKLWKKGWFLVVQAVEYEPDYVYVYYYPYIGNNLTTTIRVRNETLESLVGLPRFFKATQEFIEENFELVDKCNL